MPQPRGKVLGGSSAINVAALVYPSPRNFDAWTRLGNQGWTYDAVKPYYKKFQTFSPASAETSKLLSLDSYFKPELHGSQGPVKASFPDAYGPFNQAWMEAFDSAGFTDETDPILGRKQGAFTPPNTVNPDTKQRSYAANSYLNPVIEKRANLDILTEAFVQKVLLEQSDEVEAKGVRVSNSSSSTIDIYAGEVILAAGAFQSPLVLEYSGIGSGALLKENGIEVFIDNPAVGENLQDHAFATISVEVKDDQISGDMARDPSVIQALVKQYMETKGGMLSGIPLSLAVTPPVDSHGRMSSEDVKTLAGAHLDIHDDAISPAAKSHVREVKDLLVDPAESSCFFGLMPSQMNVKTEGKTTMQEAYSPQRPENFITIMVGLNHPFSRGSVHISGSDPKAAPAIDPKYLSHPLDMEILARGVQFLDTLVNQDAFKRLLKTEAGQRLPELAHKLRDLEVAKQVARDRLWTTYHPSCTCAMLPRELGGVVNDRLVVHGTKNLRVIDASIFPMIPMGNIQATVYAVAERACDLIKEDWNKQ